MFQFHAEVESSLHEDWTAATGTIADGCRTGVDLAVHEGAAEARATHQYKDRTGNLTNSIYGSVDKFDRFGAEGFIFAAAKYASFVDGGTQPHVIEAKGGGFLRWEEPQGDFHFARVVHHPGTSPLPFMAQAYQKAERVIIREVEVAVARASETLEK